MKPAEFVLVVLMSGQGKRFQSSGYAVPKPLIPVLGRPMVSYVLAFFEKKIDKILVTSESIASRYQSELNDVIKSAGPNVSKVVIPDHNEGPGGAVLRASDHINLSGKRVFLSYCDFGCTFDEPSVFQMIDAIDPDGMIFTYDGFHPHSVYNHLYAHVKESGGRVLDVKEKGWFTPNPIKEPTSAGLYYFKEWSVLLNSLKAQRSNYGNQLVLDNELFLSLTYKVLIDRDAHVINFPIERFHQWGTPQDLQDFEWYMRNTKMLRGVGDLESMANDCWSLPGTVIMLAAGLGTRFSEKGWATPKALLEHSSGKSLVHEAISGIWSKCKEKVLWIRAEIERDIPLSTREAYSEILTTSYVPDGQAISALLASRCLNKRNKSNWIHILPCDSRVEVAYKRMGDIFNDVDLIVWVVKSFPASIRTPESYSWINANQETDKKIISLKKRPATDTEELVVTGAFSFRNQAILEMACERFLEVGTSLSELYLDELVNIAGEMGSVVAIEKVDAFACWGTPSDYLTETYYEQVVTEGML